MHENSLAITRHLVAKFHPPLGMVLDVGSMDINGTTRPVWEAAGHRYFGMDIAAGPNVDFVEPKPHDWGWWWANMWPIVTSNNTAEHVQDLPAWFREIARILKPDGWLFVVSPYLIHEHRHPVDCWRIMPDGWRWLCCGAGLTVMETGVQGMDTYLVARKFNGETRNENSDN